MEKRVLMENSRGGGLTPGPQKNSTNPASALKQMEQMMGRNYSDFMRSLAAKYNQNPGGKE